jgi:hypothetical protein
LDNFYHIEGESVSSLGAPEVKSALQQATATQATVGCVAAAAQRATAEHAAAMHYEFGDAAVENMATADPHKVSRGLSSPINLGGFGEDGSSDVEEPAVDVGACTGADRFVASAADRYLKGETRGGLVGGDGACAFAKCPRFPYLHHLTPSRTPPFPPSLPPNTHSQLSPPY